MAAWSKPLPVPLPSRSRRQPLGLLQRAFRRRDLCHDHLRKTWQQALTASPAEAQVQASKMRAQRGHLGQAEVDTPDVGALDPGEQAPGATTDPRYERPGGGGGGCAHRDAIGGKGRQHPEIALQSIKRDVRDPLQSKPPRGGVQSPVRIHQPVSEIAALLHFSKVKDVDQLSEDPIGDGTPGSHGRINHPPGRYVSAPHPGARITFGPRADRLRGAGAGGAQSPHRYCSALLTPDSLPPQIATAWPWPPPP